MKYIIATNNPKKLKELERILNPLGINAVSAKEEGICLDDVEETGKTFADNQTADSGHRGTYHRVKEKFDYGRTCQGLGAGIAGNGYRCRPYVYCTGQQNG